MGLYAVHFNKPFRGLSYKLTSFFLSWYQGFRHTRQLDTTELLPQAFRHYFKFGDRVSLNWPGCPWICNALTSVFQVAGIIGVWSHTHIWKPLSKEGAKNIIPPALQVYEAVNRMSTFAPRPKTSFMAGTVFSQLGLGGCNHHCRALAWLLHPQLSTGLCWVLTCSSLLHHSR